MSSLRVGKRMAVDVNSEHHISFNQMPVTYLLWPRPVESNVLDNFWNMLLAISGVINIMLANQEASQNKYDLFKTVQHVTQYCQWELSFKSIVGINIDLIYVRRRCILIIRGEELFCFKTTSVLKLYQSPCFVLLQLKMTSINTFLVWVKCNHMPCVLWSKPRQCNARITSVHGKYCHGCFITLL